jgi:hypothetical protein
MMKRKLIRRFAVAVIFLISLGIGVLQLQGTPQQSSTSKNTDLDSFMQLKLEHSKEILEGLATEDYEIIAKGAQSLTALSLESAWNVYTTETYLQQSTDFRRSLQIVKDAAKEKNLDRAALGYVNLTVQCLECHRFLRNKAPGAIPFK